MFLRRALVSLIAAPIAIYLIYLGEWAYFLPLVVVLLAATVEFANMMRHMGWQPSLWILLPAVLAQYITAQFDALHYLAGPALVLALLVTLGYGLWLYEQRLSETAAADWLMMSAGIILMGWMGSHFFLVRGLDQFGHWALLTLLATWTADSGAYLTGKRFGRIKLSPRLSPNKTVEGYVGGILISAITVFIVAYFIEFPPLYALGLIILGAIISPAGDLGISLLKREAGIKDSGRFFPGHGGALDRIDSVLWAVTLAYYLAVLVR